MTNINNILKIFKDNEDQLREFGCAYNDVSEIEEYYEEEYNPFTRRDVSIFYDCDFFNGSAPTVLNFIADKMTEAGNRIFRVYEKPDRHLGCFKYKIE